MDQEAYEAFQDGVSHDNVGDPVYFQFTDDEVEMHDIDRNEHPPEKNLFSDDVRWNLSENGYGYIRAALIFQVLHRKT